MARQFRPAVLLLSGGLDSSTVLAIARSLGFRIFALSVQYGQRHKFELEAARRVVEAIRVEEHRVARVDLGLFGGSALTDEIAVPRGRSLEEMSSEIPITYVPARNTIFLAMALAWAEVLRSRDIFIGVNAVDFSGYPDCRPEFIRSFEELANLATRAGVEGSRIRIHAPLLNLNKAQIIRKGLELGVDYSLTRSCYDPDPQGRGCRECDACLLRLKGFEECGLRDPAPYGVR